MTLGLAGIAETKIGQPATTLSGNSRTNRRPCGLVDLKGWALVWDGYAAHCVLVFDGVSEALCIGAGIGGLEGRVTAALTISCRCFAIGLAKDAGKGILRAILCKLSDHRNLHI